ncbi:hypothetical protein [Microbacterium galbinum]|uniref:hypothetical protein n=1 Tax=Microbacterium galbinum TaxID=2851646 RepID=UPI001FFC457C|nr:hypothetical protein [Microbacterium galbinum]
MDGMRTMERTEILIDGVSAYLAQEQDLDVLLRQIETAASGPAAFVEFVVVGNRRVKVLITPSSRVVISTETVQHDPRDTGNDAFPYGGLYDFDPEPLG